MPTPVSIRDGVCVGVPPELGREAAAARCAEAFVRINGFTAEPVADTSAISYGPLEAVAAPEEGPAETARSVLQGRTERVEPRAWMICDWADTEGIPAYVVAFRLTPAAEARANELSGPPYVQYGRMVRMTYDARELWMIHEYFTSEHIAHWRCQAAP